MIGHAFSPVRAKVPRRRRTSRASSHQINPMECLPSARASVPARAQSHRTVVARNRDVDELHRRVGVAKRDDGDVDVGRLADGLHVGARVGHDDETRLLERAGDVVGEGSGREAAGAASSAYSSAGRCATDMAWAPVDAANLSTARWPYGRAETTQTSLGVSMAAMMRAAKTIFS